NPQPDQQQTDQPQRVGRIIEQQHTEQDGAHRTNADPDRIGGTHRQGFHGNTQQPDTDQHGQGGGNRGPQTGKPLGVFQTDSPTDLEQTCDTQNGPIHIYL